MEGDICIGGGSLEGQEDLGESYEEAGSCRVASEDDVGWRDGFVEGAWWWVEQSEVAMKDV